ncbi:MAG TPA: hypothetical protein VNO30_45495 [Kofleriaceae bacterium]|nr:hypothetical protein [Kofleriaceae bacterium]
MSTASTEAEAAFTAGLQAQRDHDISSALQHYERCLQVPNSDPVTRALATGNRAIILAQQGDLDDAIAGLDVALEGLLPHAGREPLALVRFARTRFSALGARGRFQDSFAAFQDTIDYIKNLTKSGIESQIILDELSKEEAYSLLEFGGLLLHIQEFAKAERVLSLAIHMLENHADSDAHGMTSALINHSQAIRQLGNEREALQDLSRAREFADRIRHRREAARIEALRAELLVRLNRLQEAVFPLEESIELAKQTQDLVAVVTRTWFLANIYSDLDNPEIAANLMQECESLARSAESPKVRAEFYQAFANIEHRRENSHEFDCLKASVDAWLETVELQSEPNLRVSLATELSKVARRLVVQLCQRNELEAAWDVWEASRAVGLRASVALRDVSGSASQVQIPKALGAQALFEWARNRSRLVPTVLCTIILMPDKLHLLAINHDGVPFTNSIPVIEDAFVQALSELRKAAPDRESDYDALHFEGSLSVFSGLLERLFCGVMVPHMIIMPTFELWGIPWSAALANRDDRIRCALWHFDCHAAGRLPPTLEVANQIDRCRRGARCPIC